MSRFDWYNKQREYTTHSHKNCGWNGIKPCFLLDKNRRQIGKKFTRFKRKPTRIRLRRCGLCISRDSAMYLSSSLQDENWEPKKEYNREPRTPRHNASEFMGASNPALQFPDFTVILLVFWQFCNELEPTVQYNRSARRTNVSSQLLSDDENFIHYLRLLSKTSWKCLILPKRRTSAASSIQPHNFFSKQICTGVTHCNISIKRNSFVREKHKSKKRKTNENDLHI